jgi:hypothetical protein
MEKFSGGRSSLADNSFKSRTKFFLATNQDSLLQLWSLTKTESFISRGVKAEPDLSDCPQLPKDKMAVGIFRTFSSSSGDRLEIKDATVEDNGRGVVVHWEEAANGVSTAIGSPWVISFVPRGNEVKFVCGKSKTSDPVTLRIESGNNFVAAPSLG